MAILAKSPSLHPKITIEPDGLVACQLTAVLFSDWLMTVAIGCLLIDMSYNSTVGSLAVSCLSSSW